MPEIKLKIEGMSCMHCVSAVKKAIESISGVKSNVEVGSAKVYYGDGVTSKDKIISAIEKAGYKVIE